TGSRYLSAKSEMISLEAEDYNLTSMYNTTYNNFRKTLPIFLKKISGKNFQKKLASISPINNFPLPKKNPKHISSFLVHIPFRN
ncbi:MAG: hypothetical protein WCF90_03045, partial [Methanomicrobiales archaeon]